MSFSHPLARAAKVWQAIAADGSKRDVLVVITTLELDPDNMKYKKDKVDRLAAAAHEWISRQSVLVDSVVLMSRPKDWMERSSE
jgi:hypothetical protein